MKNEVDKLIKIFNECQEVSLKLQENMNLLDAIQKKQSLLQRMKDIYGDIKLSDAISILHEQYQNALKHCKL